MGKGLRGKNVSASEAAALGRSAFNMDYGCTNGGLSDSLPTNIMLTPHLTDTLPTRVQLGESCPQMAKYAGKDPITPFVYPSVIECQQYTRSWNGPLEAHITADLIKVVAVLLRQNGVP